MLMTMIIRVIFLVFLYVGRAYSQESLMIDCGGGGDGMWQSDDDFIKTGINSQVQDLGANWGREMDSLRLFPDQSKSCYTLPAKTKQKYLIQAGFFYGNYDGRGFPPSFDLQFDGNSWASVYTTQGSPSFKEAIVFAKRDNISVCVARSLGLNDQIPFISTLVLVTLPSSMYSAMTSGSALVLESRVNFGSPYNIWIPEDIYSRIWTPDESGQLYRNVTAPELTNLADLADAPPSSMMTSAIEALNSSESLKFYYVLHEPQWLVYVNLYFTEASASSSKRLFDVYIDGENMNLNLSLQYKMGKEVSLTLRRRNYFFNLTLVSRNGSSLPPTICGIELFSVKEDLTNGTSEEDVQGLQQLTNNWKQLRGWAGDPCLPTSYTAWDWISCSDSNPPRVIALYLGSHGLGGPIVDFSQLQALDAIDLHNNSLSGPVPDFLGKLPRLDFLDLSNNQLSGTVPKSITKNKQISLRIAGNPQLRYREKKNIGLIVGLSVGGAVLVLLVVCGVVFFVLPRLNKRRENEGATVEPDGAIPEAASSAGPRGPSAVAEGNDQFEEVSEEFRKQMEVDVEDLLGRPGSHSSDDDSYRG
ncbi:hypothetical protein H6P81_006705 [Aristolochia fimbriata]|uniref:Malectin-like domain-containing protein n=1 Tax=Aristolochia fimbriata TaxID=158543 RepID=A0AAV7EZA9_ARIFI|nr:hypothetical protein H6P81_006705 [Aristolochia fimbriata]